jgi:SDR family mycofactocin-dependent oxidoreductase
MRMGLLDGKIVMVTGGARGQGRAHALVSAGEGADVLLVDIVEQVDTVHYPTATEADLAATARLVSELGRVAVPVVADVRSQQDLDRAVAVGLEEFGRIDILIANAGIHSLGSFWQLSEESWSQMLDINLSGVWRSAKAVTPHMMERGEGSMVLTSSVNGFEAGPNFAHYVAAKHGVIGLMKNIALELAPYGIRCNAVCPGAIDTAMTNNQVSWDMIAGHEGGTHEDMVDGGYAFHALRGRSFLQPEVVAMTALYLNSPLAETVTGAAIPVDAGHGVLVGQNRAPVR